MEIEKVKEIKKALEDLDMICYEKTCSDRINKISKYINELESENAKQLEENESLNGSWKMQIKKIAELESQNEEQYKRIMELEQDLVHADENVFYRKCNVTLRENEIKEQALKQFSERVKGKFEHCVVDLYLADAIDKKIDETLKEFLK